MAISKIGNPTNALPLSSGEAVKKNEVSASPVKTDDAKFSTAAASLAASSPQDSNVEKIASLRAEIANGTYKPNAQAIAGKLLHEAWQMSGR